MKKPGYSRPKKKRRICTKTYQKSLLTDTNNLEQELFRIEWDKSNNIISFPVKHDKER